MKLIKLTGKYAVGENAYTMVDDEDYEYLNQWKWNAKLIVDKIYASRTMKSIKIHRLILCVNTTEVHVDHADGNTLNNQKNNIRIATRSQNMANRRKVRGASSKYLGVSWDRCGWAVSVRFNNKVNHIGRFKNEEDAAKAYDEAAKRYHGEFANLNFK